MKMAFSATVVKLSGTIATLSAWHVHVCRNTAAIHLPPPQQIQMVLWPEPYKWARWRDM